MQAIFELILETNSVEASDDRHEREFGEEEIMSFNLIRPLNQAVLVLYIFTQGLTFRQNLFVMLPVYVLLEVGRSVSFVTLHSLDALQLMRCCGVLLLVINIIATSVYLTTINTM